MTHNDKAQITENRATRIIVSTLGILLGIGGLDHGFFEAQQGNTPTGGLLINAISAGNTWTIWKQGGEGAFTIIPNFLLTGILSMLTGLIIIIWSAGFIHRKCGGLVLLLLCIFLILVGGGIAQILFFTIAFAVSTRIHKPLNWWKKILPTGFRNVVAKVWPGTLVAFVVLFLVALEMAVIGFVPGMHDPHMVLYTCWSILGVVILLILLSIVSGFAHDIEAGNAERAGTACPNSRTTGRRDGAIRRATGRPDCSSRPGRLSTRAVRQWPSSRCGRSQMAMLRRPTDTRSRLRCRNENFLLAIPPADQLIVRITGGGL